MVGFGKKKPALPERELFLFTTEVLPEHFVIKEMFHMVEVYDKVILSKQSILDRMFSSKKNKVDKLLIDFAAVVPQEANAVLGVKTTVTTAAFSNGTYLFVIHSGTPAIIEKIETGE